MRVLISGGSGMIGSEITRQLNEKGHEVRHLSRDPDKNATVKEFHWDPDSGSIDEQAMDGIDAIVNLAGAPLNQRWTPEYKSLILRSRIDSTRLLFNTTQKLKVSLKCFVSASANGYYPNDPSRVFTESDPPGSDFLSLVCQKWEQEAQNFETLNIRTVRCRIGLVLSDKGGALKPIATTVKFGIGAPLGCGRQWVSWIHISDIAGIFVHALENEKMQGVYNASSNQPVTNREFTRKVAKVMDRPLLLPKVPAPVLKVLLGEMAEMPLASNRLSAVKILGTGYKFKYEDLEVALRDVLQ